jgi:HAD superfamily hydrolase (TIGR01509 family)
MIKAIIFDMDGLLINSEPVWFKARKDLCSTYNINWTWDHQKNNMGVSTRAWVEYMRNLLGDNLSSEEILNGIIDRMVNYYKKGEIELMPYANESLEYCHGKYSIGLASGSYKKLLHTAIETNNWSNYFNHILSSDDMERGKPFPDIYIEIVKRLGVKPEESIVLEDSRDGIIAGVTAGTNVIAVPGKEVEVPKDVLNSASEVINSLKDFPKALDKILKSM